MKTEDPRDLDVDIEKISDVWGSHVWGSKAVSSKQLHSPATAR